MEHQSKKHFVKLDRYQSPYTCCVKCEDKIGFILWTNLLIPLSVVFSLLIALQTVFVFN